METSYFVILLLSVVVLMGVLLFYKPVVKFKGKRIEVRQIILVIIFVYYLVNGIRTGNIFDFAFAGLFIAFVLIEYFRRKNMERKLDEIYNVTTTPSLQAENDALKKEIEMLKREIEILKEAAGVRK
ncbi:MAG TPA: hypothetical protein VI757_12955 [Bacteroidia bacterium]|nr:hypothetical protein [Bacteroidia bacterium]